MPVCPTTDGPLQRYRMMFLTKLMHSMTHRRCARGFREDHRRPECAASRLALSHSHSHSHSHLAASTLASTQTQTLRLISSDSDSVTYAGRRYNGTNGTCCWYEIFSRCRCCLLVHVPYVDLCLLCLQPKADRIMRGVVEVLHYYARYSLLRYCMHACSILRRHIYP